MIRNRHFPFWILTFSAALLLVVSQLIQDGMFMDGMLYVSVSKNLANGIGTFWNPHFSKTSMSSFHEQPPLYFGLLAVFYKIIGTSMYIERIFCFLTFFITGYFIKKIWAVVYMTESKNKLQSWLPILIWITIPVCFWSYANNVEETLMGVFTIISVYFISKALVEKKQLLLNLALAGFFIFLASLTKGPQGLFPIASAGLFWLVNFKKYSFKRCVLHTALLAVIPTVIYSILITSPIIYNSFEMYFTKRFVPTFNNIGATTKNHFEILFRLLEELTPALLFTGILLFFSKSIKQVRNTNLNISIWFALIGLSGSLPLMITLEQRRFYLTTSLPFFAIAISVINTNTISTLINKINRNRKRFRILEIISILIFLSSIIYTITRIGNYKRDKELLADVYLMNKIIPYGEIISCTDNMWNEWSIYTYFNRYNYVSIESISNKQHHFLISYKNSDDTLYFYRYKQLNLNTQVLNLYQLK